MILTGRAVAASLLAVGLAGSALGAQVTRPDTVRADTTARPDSLLRLVARRDSAITPGVDQALGVDAEIRAALFELMADQWLPALDRMQWLYASPVAFSDSVARAGLRGRQDLLFLLSQTYYRLGLSEPFRRTAEPLLQDGVRPRFIPLLQSQLLMDAYRRGEHARVATLVGSMGGASAPPAIRGLASLIAGLAAYEMRDYPGAAASFAAARQAGAPYADYAQYMEALTQLRIDTSATGPALASMEEVARRSTGIFADQVRLTAAQLAYESGRFDDAVRLAEMITPASGVGAEALFTRAWSLYKAERLPDAAEAFMQFADRFPQLPEHEESRLMAAQALLELERTDSAGTIFRLVADSTMGLMNAIRGRTPQAVADAARRLVSARAAGLLFVADPAIGKTVVLGDADGVDWSVFADTPPDTISVLPTVATPRIVGLDVIGARVDSVLGAPVPAAPGVVLAASMPAVPRRLFFTQASAGRTRADYIRGSQDLYAADVAYALARWRLDEAVAAQARQMALLTALRNSLAGEEAALARTLAELDGARDSIAAVTESLDLTAEWVRRMFAAQLEFTRTLAAENQRMIDSLRSSLGGNLQEAEAQALQYESQTAQTYQRVASVIDAALEGAIAHHPAFALRDSARARLARIEALVDETRLALASARDAIDAELARLGTGDSERVIALRAELAVAEQQRARAEAQLVAIVGAEIDARAAEMLAMLQRDSEAAEFGAASAAFFQVMEATRAAEASDTRTTSAGSAAGAPSRTGATPVPTPPRQP